jgi:hypothetical protein
MDTPQVLLDHHLKTLRLPTFLREYDKLAQQCAAEGVDFPRYLLRLSELELLDRERRATERRIRQAKFEVVKSLDTFEFLAIPSLNKSLVLDLARCEFIERKENILALGNSGTGKTHIALALGLAACQKGFRVRRWPGRTARSRRPTPWRLASRYGTVFSRRLAPFRNLGYSDSDSTEPGASAVTNLQLNLGHLPADGDIAVLRHRVFGPS